MWIWKYNNIDYLVQMESSDQITNIITSPELLCYKIYAIRRIKNYEIRCLDSILRHECGFRTFDMSQMMMVFIEDNVRI